MVLNFLHFAKIDVMQSRYDWIGDILNRLMLPDSVLKYYSDHMYHKNISEHFARVLKVVNIL